MASTHEIDFIASSSTDLGAINRSADGSCFQIQLSEPIQIPEEATSITVALDEATIWFNTHNISAALGNNHWRIEHSTTTFDIIVPDGLYSLSDLSASLDRLMLTAIGLSGLVTLIADNAQQKTVIRLNQATTQVILTAGDSFRDVLGFTSKLVPSGAPSAGVFNETGANKANFSPFGTAGASSNQSWQVHSDLVNRGIKVGNDYTHIIAQVPIDVSPGGEVIYGPEHPALSDAFELAGAVRNSMRFWLTDQSGTLVDTQGEDYSLRVCIRYVLPEWFTDHHHPAIRRQKPHQQM